MAHAAAAASGARGGRAKMRFSAMARNRMESGGKAEEALRSELAQREERRKTMAAEDPLRYLLGLGLGNLSPGAASRRLAIAVLGHEEEHGFTMYQIRCTLRCACDVDTGEMENLSWVVKRRLCELREDLYDVIVKSLGPEYDVQFAGVPFAMRGGPPGTSSRLRSWLEVLAACINTRGMAPELCAQLLCTLGAPTAEERVGLATPRATPRSLSSAVFGELALSGGG
eukprot:TRINITY_DN29763_c0_g1_i1.p1 TRINITY_DN29763_c0_g1~~TRINITY_DN29763_c0_g1_i1.p1  ORF type:complete len:267 (-),score=54.93 TRINITY_DN29763_c0_g1_i1:130-810(-)